MQLQHIYLPNTTTCEVIEVLCPNNVKHCHSQDKVGHVGEQPVQRPGAPEVAAHNGGQERRLRGAVLQPDDRGRHMQEHHVCPRDRLVDDVWEGRVAVGLWDKSSDVVQLLYPSRSRL